MQIHPTLQKIISKVHKYHSVRYDIVDNTISLTTPEDKGFGVRFEVGNKEFIVSADQWHTHFDIAEEEDALGCFAFLLSDACRLRIEYQKEEPIKWTIQSFENGKWVDDSSTGRFNFRFWQTTRVQYFQNTLIKSK